MPDLVLIHPGGQKQIYQTLALELTAVEPPIWCGLIAEYARRLGYSVKILDANAENLTPEEAAKVVFELNPTLAAVVVYGHQPSASTQHMPAAGAICRAVKQTNPVQKILMLGGHVAALPERTLLEEAVDFVCSGEGPKTVVALVESLKAVGDDFQKVPDLWYKAPDRHCEAANPLRPKQSLNLDCRVAKNAPRNDDKNTVEARNDVMVRYTFSAPLISDLDLELPQIAWDLLPMDRYRAHNWHCFGGKPRTPYASIYTTLGCPYHCEFCCIQAPFRNGEAAVGTKAGANSYRFWKPETVVAQIDRLVERYGVRNIKIADELFILNREHVETICDLLIERNHGLNLWAYARVDSIPEALIPKLKQAGFHWLALGIEAADPGVRTAAKKGYRQELIREVIGKLDLAGIYVIANYIFGLSEDTLHSMQATLDLAVELNTEFANFYCTMAYPGSAIYEQSLRDGRPLPKVWSGYSQHSKDAFPLPTKTLSSRKVLEFRDKAFVRYFSRPEYQSMIERKFGAEARREIETMLSVSMERSHSEVTGSLR